MYVIIVVLISSGGLYPSRVPFSWPIRTNIYIPLYAVTLSDREQFDGTGAEDERYVNCRHGD